MKNKEQEEKKDNSIIEDTIETVLEISVETISSIGKGVGKVGEGIGEIISSIL